MKANKYAFIFFSFILFQVNALAVKSDSDLRHDKEIGQDIAKSL